MVVVMVDIGIDCGDKFQHVAKHSAPEAVDRKVPKEALHHVEPRSASGREVDMEPWMALQPALNGGMLMRRVVVHDQMQLLAVGCGIVIEAQEAKPFLMPVTLL